MKKITAVLFITLLLSGTETGAQKGNLAEINQLVIVVNNPGEVITQLNIYE